MQLPVNNSSRIWLVIRIGLVLSLVFSSQQFVQAESSPSFNCYRKTSGEYLTLLHLPSGKKYVVISWGRSGAVNARCSEATNNLQKFFNSGRLNYIVGVRVNNKSTIVCGLALEGGPCNSKNRMFDLLHGDTISMLIQRIGGNTPSDEKTSAEILINFKKVIKDLTIQSE
jgi:Circadian oscillating protein COP23